MYIYCKILMIMQNLLDVDFFTSSYVTIVSFGWKIFITVPLYCSFYGRFTEIHQRYITLLVNSGFTIFYKDLPSESVKPKHQIKSVSTFLMH